MDAATVARKKAIVTVAMPILVPGFGLLLAHEAGLFRSWEGRFDDLAAGGSMVMDPLSREGLPADTLGADTLGVDALTPAGPPAVGPRGNDRDPGPGTP